MRRDSKLNALSVVCWECNRSVEADLPTCPPCGAVQPLPAGVSYFAVLGVPEQFDVDLVALEKSFKDLSRRFHPDRFATADARARKISLSRSTAINDGFRTLKDPMRRAAYLLKRLGVDVGREDAGGPKLPPSFLMRAMEEREALAEARAAGDAAKVRALAAATEAAKRSALDEMARAFSAGDPKVAAEAFLRVRYHDRLLEEVSVWEDDLQASHG